MLDLDKMAQFQRFLSAALAKNRQLWIIRDSTNFRTKLEILGISMAFTPRNPNQRNNNTQQRNRRKPKTKVKTVRKDPLFVDGERPRPMYVDYKNVELLKKLVNRHGKIVSRRKTGCTAVSQHAVSKAVKRARFMALMPYVGE